MTKLLCWSICALLATTSLQASESTNGIFDTLLKEGEIDLSFRYRYEFVDQDCCDPSQAPGTEYDEDAHASSVRSRLTLKSGSVFDTQLMLEIDDVRNVLVNDFNVGAGNTVSREKYPEVNDPDGTEINQAYIDYRGFESFGLRIGRQRINLDNQRFIGGVAWRQNEQTYDSFTGTYKHDRFDAFYGYVRKVRRIFGDDVPAGSQKQDGTHLANISGDIGDWGRLSGYYYYIDNQDASLFSTSTFGARFAGKRPLNRFSVRYELEYAYQEDAGNNLESYDADYLHADIGVIIDNFDIGLGYELLSGDEDGRFVTPLGTLHAFNGWADKFIAGGTGNPVGGLEDRYLKVTYNFADYIVEGRFHDFDGDDSGDDLGQEINLRIGRPFGDHLRGDLYYADFDGEGEFASTNLSDTRKFWLQLMVTF
jgi:hypothetical protein